MARAPHPRPNELEAEVEAEDVTEAQNPHTRSVDDAQPAPHDVTIPPAIVGIRWITTQDSAVLEYTTDAQTWIVVPQTRIDA